MRSTETENKSLSEALSALDDPSADIDERQMELDHYFDSRSDEELALQVG